MSDQVDQNHRRPRLRPGAELFEVSEDKLHIAFPNHTVTFTTPIVTAGIKALLAAMEQDYDRHAVIVRVSTDNNLEPGFVSYLFEMLAASHCLYWSESEPKATNHGETLWDYFASIGESPAEMKELLAAVRPVVLTSESGRQTLVDALNLCGISADVLPLLPGTSVREIASELRSHFNATSGLVVSWDFPYRSPAAQVINQTSMEGIPVLFGACEGLVARIGPYVIPMSTPCLECLNSRLLSHGGAEELSCFTAYRLRHQHVVQQPKPTHPVFLSSVAGFLVLELMQILLRRPPRTLGGIVEYGLADGSVVRRSLFKVPRCAACRTAQPPRLAWNVTFESPRVKGNSDES
jgi:bacteriocin biosynthesis cyclodehydratase domain-containing protein